VVHHFWDYDDQFRSFYQNTLSLQCGFRMVVVWYTISGIMTTNFVHFIKILFLSNVALGWL
jgi:hypothetical protein